MMSNVKFQFMMNARSKIEKIKSCVTCTLSEQKQDGHLHVIEIGELRLVTYYIDHLGPLPSTRKDYKYMFIVIFQFILQIKQREIKFSIGQYHFGYKFVFFILCCINSLNDFLKELKVCLHELSIVDDTLEALGAPKKYRVLRKWILRIIIGWITYIFIDFVRIIITNGVLYSFESSFRYCIEFFITVIHLKYIITSSVLICGTVLGYTSSRFHRVNNLLRIIYSDIFENNADYRCTRQNRSILVSQWITGAKNRKQYMWIIMHVHLQLCLISRKLNKIFNIQMSLQMLWYLVIYALPSIYNIYTLLDCNVNYVDCWSFKNTVVYIDEILEFIPNIVLFLTLNYLCQTIYYKVW
ncbi:hypothetical protein ALC62_09603 [Cyphomyrmex costatus]|uniref:Gustatory receptor n=1 Tax=Cyphomyrmex costatus TaxID=456900 RepID=A0A151IG08_9HYME|nr:hypothetical protein ALC62_09603 [Cyphomyrmex costatus]